MEGGPFSAFEDAGVVGGAGGEGDGGGVGLSAGVARVGAVDGVENGAAGVGVGHGEGGGVLGVEGGVDGGVEVAGAELVEEDGGALLEVGAGDPLLHGEVVVVAGVEVVVGGGPDAGGLDVAAEVSPAGGLGDDGEVHIIRAAAPDGFGSDGREGAAVKEGGVGGIGEGEAVFGVFGEVLMDAGGAVGGVFTGDVGVE